MVSDESNFIHNWWAQILFGFMSTFALAKALIVSNQMHRMLYDRYGIPRVKWAEDCEKCRLKCQEDTQQKLVDIINEMRHNFDAHSKKLDAIQTQIHENYSKLQNEVIQALKNV